MICFLDMMEEREDRFYRQIIFTESESGHQAPNLSARSNTFLFFNLSQPTLPKSSVTILSYQILSKMEDFMKLKKFDKTFNRNMDGNMCAFLRSTSEPFSYFLIGLLLAI